MSPPGRLCVGSPSNKLPRPGEVVGTIAGDAGDGPFEFYACDEGGAKA